MPEENVIVGVQLDFSAGNAEQTAAKVKALADSLAEEHATSQSKGGAGTADLGSRLKEIQKQVTQAFKAAGDFASTPEAKALQSEIRQYLNSLAKAAQQGVADAMSDVSRTSGAQRVRGGAIREGGREREQERDPNLYRRNAQGRPTYRGRFVTEEEYGRMQRAPGGYGPPGGGRPPAPPTAAEPPEEPRKLTATERRRLAEAGRLGIPGADQLGGAELISQTRRYQELERGNPRRGIPGVNPQGMSPEQVDAKLEELQVAAAEAAVALREVTVATKEQEAAAKAARGGVVADARGAPQQGFMRELLQASTLGIGGYRRFGHLQEGQLAGGAAAALPTGLITGGAFTAFYALQQGVSQAVRSAVQLDRQLADVKDTVQSMGQGDQFDKIRESILGIADATGVAAGDVASLSQIFLGLTGNVDAATAATKAVAEYIEVTGENAQTAGAEVAAISQAFPNLTQKDVANASIEAARRSGRTAPEIQAGVAALAPEAAAYGLTANQTYGLVAQAGQRSALPGATVGTDLGRVLESIQQNSQQIQQYVPFTQPGNYQQDLQQIVQKIQSLPTTGGQGNERRTLLDLIGGTRNQPIISSLAAGGNLVGGTYTGTNALDSRRATVQATAADSLRRLSEAAQTFVNQVLNSGLGTTLADLARTASGFLHVLGDVASGFGRLNTATGDVGGKLIALAAATLVLQRVGRAAAGGVVGVRDVIRGRRGGGDDAEDGERTKSTATIQEEVAERQTSVGWLQRFWQALEQLSGATTEATGAMRAATGAADTDAAAHELDAGKTNLDAAAKVADTKANALPAGGSAASKAEKTGASTAEKDVEAGGEVAAGAAVAKKGKSIFDRIRGVGSRAVKDVGGAAEDVGGLAEDAAGATGVRGLIGKAGKLPLIGGGLGADVGIGDLLGLPGLLAAGAGFGAYKGTGAILHNLPFLPQPDNVPKTEHGLPEATDQFYKTFADTHRKTLTQLEQVATPAQDKIIQQGLKKGAGADKIVALVKVWNDLMDTAAGLKIEAAGGFVKTPAQIRAAGLAQGNVYSGQDLGVVNPNAPVIGKGPLANLAGVGIQFTQVSDVQTAFSTGMLDWSHAVSLMTKSVTAATDPMTEVQQAMQLFAAESQHSVNAITQVAQLGQTIGGLSPTAALAGTVGAFTSPKNANLTGDALVQMGATIAQQVSQSNDYLLQNMGRAGGFAGATPGGLVSSGANLLLGGQGQTISGAAAQRINAGYQQQGYGSPFTISGGVGTSAFTPQQVQAGAQANTSLQQSITQQQIAQAQARQASQTELNQIQTQGDQQVLSLLQQEQAANPNANLQPQILAASTKVASDVVATQQTNLQNIQALSQYTQALDFQNPLRQAQDQIGQANASAASLGTSVAQLQATPFNQLSAQQQGILEQWATGQQALFQSIGSNVQTQIAYLQSGAQANPLRQAQQAIGSLAGQAVAQFGSQANARAQAAAGNPAAQQLVTQQNQANFQAYQAQNENTQAFWQEYASQAEAMGNSLVAAGANVQAGKAAVALFKQKFPADANLGNSQFAALVTQLNQAQGAYFAAQLQQIQSISQLQQAQIALTGNTPAVAANALASAKAALAAFKAKFPTQANAGNAEFAQLQAAVYQAQGNLLDQTISYNETQISELVATNKISIGQAITKLRALQAQAAAAGNQADVLKIQADIQQYINQGNENAAFNLPTNLNLPTLYEVRRTEGTPKGGNYYGNTGPVNVNINISNQVDVQPAVNALIRSIGGPPTSGLNLP